MMPGNMALGTRGGGAEAAAETTTLDLSNATVISDTGSYIDAITSSNILTTTAGSAGSTSLPANALLNLGGTLTDGMYTWDLTRSNPGQLDKCGVTVGFDDSASNSRTILGGLFETTSVREIDYTTSATLSFATVANLNRVKVTIRLATDASGDRVIGPGWIQGYNGDTIAGDPIALTAQHTVTGTLRKIAYIRRGTSGSPVGDLDYALTETRQDLP